MTLYQIKPQFQSLLWKLAVALHHKQIHADWITACGLGFSAAAGALLATGELIWLVPPLLFARIACNALDGMVARRSGTARPLGTILNEAGDRLADLLCFGGLLLSGVLPPLAEIALLPLLLFVSYLGIVGMAAGGSRCYAGPLGKADRMLVLGAYCVVAPFAPSAGLLLGWTLIGGLSLTALNRLRTIAGEHGLLRQLPAPSKHGS